MKTRQRARARTDNRGRGNAVPGQDGRHVLNDDRAQRFFERGVHVTAVTTVMRGADALYRAWRRLENLPRFIDTLEHVEDLGGCRTRWTTAGPGGPYSWEAEIIAEEPPYRLAWKSVGQSPVENAGSIRFRELPDGRGTEVRVALEYLPPGAKVGHSLAKLFGGDARTQVRRALHRFRQVMETGEVPVAKGQPAGSSAFRSDRPGQSDRRRTESELRDIAGNRSGSRAGSRRYEEATR